MSDQVKQVWRSLITYEQAGREAHDLLSLAGRPPSVPNRHSFGWSDAAFFLIAIAWLAALGRFLIYSFP